MIKCDELPLFISSEKFEPAPYWAQPSVWDGKPRGYWTIRSCDWQHALVYIASYRFIDLFKFFRFIGLFKFFKVQQNLESLSPVARVTHGFHPRAAGTHDGGSPTDASPSQPDTKKCMQVGRATYAVTSQPGTSYTFNPGIDTRTFQGQRPQPVKLKLRPFFSSICGT